MDIGAAENLHFETFKKAFQLMRTHHFVLATFSGGHGIDDGNQGVQWNAWVSPGSVGYVGVNLEGQKYDGWPVARLIQRELGSFSLYKVAKTVDQPEQITVRWARDAWGAGGDHDIWKIKRAVGDSASAVRP